MSGSESDPFNFQQRCYHRDMRSDEELVVAWRAGDKRAGSELFQRHFEAVRRFFRNKVSDPEQLEELVQATFVACVESRDRFEGRASFRAYLLGIARNHCCKHWSSQSKRKLEDDILDQPVAAMSDRPSTVVARTETERMLLAALRHLPLRDQSIVELYYWEELSGREIGEVLGIPEDSVRSVLLRAKHKLGKELRRMELVLGMPPSTEQNLEDWARELRASVDAPA
jgi:RNA polymerase sigma factor (sigma-70 family)